MANVGKVWNGTAWVDLGSTATFQSAGTATVGVVQLTDSTSSTSTTTAATPNSVKSAYDLAGTAIPKNTVTAAGDILYASGSATVTRLGIGTANQVLSVSAGVPAWTTPGASGGVLKYQEFISSGNFVLPTSMSSSAIIVLDVVGAGAGGDGGGQSNAGTAASGGNGGAGGAKGQFIFSASTFGTAGGTVVVTIGAGGAGGAARTTAGNPNLGSSGGTTSFGSLNFNGAQSSINYYTATGNVGWDAELYLVAQSFTPQGSAAGSALPTGTMKIVNDGAAAVKASWGGVAEQAAFRSAWDSAGICAGGGSGGGHTFPGVFKRGGNGGKFNNYQNQIVAISNGYEPYVTYGNGASGGTTAGANGSNSAADSHDGAGGGAGAVSATGGNGGAGAIGGGGGGGGSSQGGTSGAGGAGGSGRIRAWVIG